MAKISKVYFFHARQIFAIFAIESQPQKLVLMNYGIMYVQDVARDLKLQI